MKLNNLLEFRKDLYFEGAVQADWFYSPEKASKVSENFVFHGKQYFGIEDQGIGNRKRIDTISLVEELLSKLNDDRSNALSLAVADYGTGKSHLAVTLAQIFSGSDYMPVTYNRIIDNISNIDEEAGKKIGSLSRSRNFVMVINGMRDFNLHSEILKAAQKSLKLYGLSDDFLRKINRAIETAEVFFERNYKNAIDLFKKYAMLKEWRFSSDDDLVNQIKEKLMTNDEAFEIVNSVYLEINGQEIRWDEGLSASNILEALISECCGMNGQFDHIIILFDEFGRYLEYTSGVNAARSGESAIQQIYELTQKTQNVEGYLHVINFIQSDIKTYLQRVDQTKNISRYIGRYDESEKYYISSNLETVFANLIQRKDKEAFKQTIVKWQDSKENDWKLLFQKMNKWLVTKGMWKNYDIFRKVVVEGIYPLHPLSTFMLTNLSDYLQNRSSLTLISNYIEEKSDIDISALPFLILPENIISGDLYVEMLSAEQEGRQKTQQCIKYDNVLRKFSDKLSEKSLVVLRSNLILRVLRFKTTDYDDAIDALSICSGLSISEIKEELKWLEDEYAVLEFDDHAGVFDFTEESNGAHDFKVLKKRLLSSCNIDNSIVSTIKIKEILNINEFINTNFGIQHKISTSEWLFKQDLYPIEQFTAEKVAIYLKTWESAVNVVSPKGNLIWLYINKNSNSESIDRAISLVKSFEGKPIIIMLINDIDNRLFDCLKEYTVLDDMDDAVKKKYERHFQEDLFRVESNLKDEMESLKKARQRITTEGVSTIPARLSVFLTSVFDFIYPNAVPFFFDGFVTKNNNIAAKASGYYCAFLKMLFSNSVSETTIRNFVVEMRGRAEALFLTTSATSWKCIDEEFKLIPPIEKNSRMVYDLIYNKIYSEKEVPISYIYDTFSKPPYGMSEEVITLLIAVTCANLSYCVRIRYNGIKNINVWKDEIIINNDKKIDIKAIKSSTLVFVNEGEVSGKYIQFFDKVKKNKIIGEVAHLKNQLDEMTKADEVPESLETAYQLALKTLETGRKASSEWSEEIGKIDDLYEEGIEKNGFYQLVKAKKSIKQIPLKKIFEENGFIFDDNSKQQLMSLQKEITDQIRSKIKSYVANMHCKSIAALNTFRNHNTKIEEMLIEVGHDDFAALIRERKEKIMESQEEIRSREALSSDCNKFLSASSNDKFISYTAIVSFIKEGRDISQRIEKFADSLGGDITSMMDKVSNRLSILETERDKIIQNISEIWDGLCEIKSNNDILRLISKIRSVLQQGLAKRDNEPLEELLNNLEALTNDIEILQNISDSLVEANKVSADLKHKYENSDFDFDVIEVIEGVSEVIIEKIKEKENYWVKTNLSLGDKSRKSVYHWKDRIKALPEYLSEETIQKVKELDKEADVIISDGKIEDVLFYFDKLSLEEKKMCIQKIQEKI
ncbi:MAG: hypothetical protein J6A58_13065 [Oscillospiraceae bacterium]|nr:hypothetical protein [Oscillospiraceae bacterium]